LGNNRGVVIFSYTGSPQVKISQKVLGGFFFDSHCSVLCSLPAMESR